MSLESQAITTAADAVLPNDLPTLKKGSKSEAVRLLQQILIISYGYSITFDADFGAKTENAVKDFQGKQNLSKDGVVSKNTWRALGANLRR